MAALFPRDTQLRLEINGQSFSRVVGKFVTYNGIDLGELALAGQVSGYLQERVASIGAKSTDRLTLPGFIE